MPEKFLILGANSFYGSNFARLVEERGDIAIRSPHRLGDFLDYGRDAECCVVNFASKSLVVESWDMPWDWMQTNGTDTTAFLWMMNEARVRRFVHVSTPEVYGSNNDWITENYTDWKPSTPYAVSRAAGDMMLKAYHKAYGFPAIITRTANIYGPGQQDYRLIPKALRYKREDKTFPMHGGGWSVRSFIHINDACEATYLVYKQGVVGETYHISTWQDHFVRQVVEMIGCEIDDVEDRLGKDYSYKLNSDKIRALGWKDTISLEEGLCELSR